MYSPSPRPLQHRHMDALGHLRTWIEAYGFLVDIIEAIFKFPSHSSGKWVKFTHSMPIQKFKTDILFNVIETIFEFPNGHERGEFGPFPTWRRKFKNRLDDVN